MSVIIGKTNGANSSEFAFAKAVVGIIIAIKAAAVTAGIVSPDVSDTIDANLNQLMVGLIAVWTAYASLRTALKASIVAKDKGE